MLQISIAIPCFELMNVMNQRLSALDLATNPTRRVPLENPISFLDLEVPRIEATSIAAAVHDTALKGPIEEIKAAYGRLKAKYHQVFSLTFRRRVVQLQAGISKGRVLISRIYKAVDPLIDIFRNTVLSGEPLMKPIKGFPKFAKKTRLFSVFSIPVAIYALVKGGVGVVKSGLNGDRGELLEQGLDVMDSLSDLSYSIGTFIDGLIAASVVEKTAALTAASTYLAGIGAIFSVAVIGLQSKFIYESVKLKNRITKVFGSDDKIDFKAVVEEFDKFSNARLARRVGVTDGEKLKARMHAIYERNSNPEGNAEHKKNLTSAFNALKARINWNIVGRYLKITAAVISLIGVAILLASPAAPAGYAILAIATAIGLAVLIMDYKTENDLNDHLKMLAPNDSPEMWKFYGKRKSIEEMENDPVLRVWDLSEIGKDVSRKPVRQAVPLPNARRVELSDEAREEIRRDAERFNEQLREAENARARRLAEGSHS